MVSEGLTQFLFEIASDERLGILQATGRRPLRHAEIARTLGMTGSETTRHLNRLAEAGLVSKNPRGQYEPTLLAEALLTGLPFLVFLTAHRRYLLDHRLAALPTAFVERIGELAQGAFVGGTYRVVALQEAALRAVARRIWVVTEQRFEAAIPIFRAKVQAGADVRIVRSRPHLEEEKRAGLDVPRNFPVKSLPTVDLFLAVLDDQAGLCLPGPDGHADLGTMILLTDAEGVRWAEDLFRLLWERADPWRIPLAPSTARDGSSRRVTGPGG